VKILMAAGKGLTIVFTATSHRSLTREAVHCRHDPLHRIVLEKMCFGKPC
jgi:hypothetical protein